MTAASHTPSSSAPLPSFSSFDFGGGRGTAEPTMRSWDCFSDHVLIQENSSWRRGVWGWAGGKACCHREKYSGAAASTEREWTRKDGEGREEDGSTGTASTGWDEGWKEKKIEKRTGTEGKGWLYVSYVNAVQKTMKTNMTHGAVNLNEICFDAIIWRGRRKLRLR